VACVCVRAKMFCVLLSKDTITHLRVQFDPQAAKINFSKLYQLMFPPCSTDLPNTPIPTYLVITETQTGNYKSSTVLKPSLILVELIRDRLKLRKNSWHIKYELRYFLQRLSTTPFSPIHSIQSQTCFINLQALV
jgi:hypothetical protein